MPTSVTSTSFRLVIIANPARANLDDRTFDTFVTPIPISHRSKLHRLKDGVACEVSVVSEHPGDARADQFKQIERHVLTPARMAGFDAALLPDDPDVRRKSLLVADMESTIIEQEMLDELGDLIGKRDVIETITARAMRGELDFEAALRERVAMLAGLDARVLDEVAQRITIMPGARELIATMKANGAWCALVSGGFTVFTERIARQLGFDEHQANTLEIIDGKITGRVMEPILGREAKLAALKRIAAERGIDTKHTLAVGDGANDLAMLTEASLGVAFRAKPKVREAALANCGGAVITQGDLTALLYLQGYSESEFSTRA